MLGYYKNISEKLDRDVRELSNYLSIKGYFYQFWDEVEPVSKEDKKLAYELLINKNYYYQYDYVIISNMIHHFSLKEADLIILKSFPLKDEVNRDEKTKKFAYNVMINIITKRIYDNNLDYAEKYLELAKKQDGFSNNYSYRLDIEYLTNLLKLVVTGEPEYYNNVLKFIEIFKMIGDHKYAERLNKELKSLAYDKGSLSDNFPVGLIKEK